MDSLRIEQTDDSPLIDFNLGSNTFVMAGESRPENASKFYAPVLAWITAYKKAIIADKSNNNPTKFIFKLDYFNSSSAKYIMDIMFLIKSIIDEGGKFEIEWHYDKRDDDMLEAGKEFSSKFYTNIDMKMVEF